MSNNGSTEWESPFLVNLRADMEGQATELSEQARTKRAEAHRIASAIEAEADALQEEADLLYAGARSLRPPTRRGRPRKSPA